MRGGHRLGITGETVKEFFRTEDTRRFALTILISVVYALGLIGRVAYPLATAVYIVAFILAFEYRWTKPLSTQVGTVLFALLIGVATSGAVTAVFRYVFLVNLPG
jgi:hypothetical protein